MILPVAQILNILNKISVFKFWILQILHTQSDKLIGTVVSTLGKAGDSESVGLWCPVFFSGRKWRRVGSCGRSFELAEGGEPCWEVIQVLLSPPQLTRSWLGQASSASVPPHCHFLWKTQPPCPTAVLLEYLPGWVSQGYVASWGRAEGFNCLTSGIFLVALGLLLLLV